MLGLAVLKSPLGLLCPIPSQVAFAFTFSNSEEWTSDVPGDCSLCGVSLLSFLLFASKEVFSKLALHGLPVFSFLRPAIIWCLPSALQEQLSFFLYNMNGIQKIKLKGLWTSQRWGIYVFLIFATHSTELGSKIQAQTPGNFFSSYQSCFAR